jgi:hypothetical protein
VVIKAGWGDEEEDSERDAPETDWSRMLQLREDAAPSQLLFLTPES